VERHCLIFLGLNFKPKWVPTSNWNLIKQLVNIKVPRRMLTHVKEKKVVAGFTLE
jgi:hypothetical protein